MRKDKTARFRALQWSYIAIHQFALQILVTVRTAVKAEKYVNVVLQDLTPHGTRMVP
jgi:hypothetical protein